MDTLYEVGDKESREKHASGLLKTLGSLLAQNELVDCTLVCKDGNLQAHKVILASSCPYLRSLFASQSYPTPCIHPMVFLRKWVVEDVKHVIRFMYTGRMFIPFNKLDAILDLCEELEYKDLANLLMKRFPRQSQRTRNENSVVLILNHSSSASTTNPPSSGSSSSSTSSKRPATSPSHPSPAKTPEVRELQEVHDVTTTGGESEKVKDTGALKEVQEIKKEKEDWTDHDPNSAQTPVLSEDEEYVLLKPTKKQKVKEDEPKTEVIKIEEDNEPEPEVKVKTEKVEDPLDDEDDMIYLDYDDEEEEYEMLEKREGDNQEGQFPIRIVNPHDLLEISHSQEQDTSTTNKIYQKNPSSSSLAYRTYPCNQCSLIFSNTSELQSHKNNHHASIQRPFECEYCHVAFARSAHLRRHLRVHTGEKPYVCTVCYRAFARQDKLKGHMERHNKINLAGPTEEGSGGIGDPTPPQPQQQQQQSSSSKVPTTTIRTASGTTISYFGTGESSNSNSSSYLQQMPIRVILPNQYLKPGSGSVNILPKPIMPMPIQMVHPLPSSTFSSAMPLSPCSTISSTITASSATSISLLDRASDNSNSSLSFDIFR